MKIENSVFKFCKSTIHNYKNVDFKINYKPTLFILKGVL